VHAAARVRRVGARTANNAGSVVMPAYTTLDLGAATGLLGGEVALKLRNATDEVYATRGYGNGSQVLLGEPRALELSYAVKF